MRKLACHIFLVLLGVSWGLSSCSSPQTREDTDEQTQKTSPPPKEAEPECYPGCMLDEDGNCTLEANSMDWSSVGTETVVCDPICCEKGNPESPDQDDDGLLDEQDDCPDAPEDYDGFEDEDGCPDPDNDGDGILDDDDVCPLDAEVVNGYQDEDGCPDQAPPPPEPVEE